MPPVRVPGGGHVALDSQAKGGLDDRGRGTEGHEGGSDLDVAAREVVAAAIPIVGRRGIPVVAVDLPSGINPDDGTVPDPTVLAATVTVTFGAVKAGLLLEPAARYAGRVELIDLGLGDELARMTPLVTTA